MKPICESSDKFRLGADVSDQLVASRLLLSTPAVWLLQSLLLLGDSGVGVVVGYQ